VSGQDGSAPIVEAREISLQAPLYNVREKGAQKPLDAGENPVSEALVPLPDSGEFLLPPARLPLDQNPAAVYLAGLSPGSRRTMRASLNTIAGLLTNGAQTDALALDWSRLRFSHTAAVRSLLAERYSASTANKMLSALRGTLKAAWRLGQMTAEEYQRASDVGTVLGETLPAGRAVAAGELVGLMSACAKTERIAGVRDAAMLALLYGCGLRRAELVSLDLADYDPGSGDGQAALKVQGKRNKARLAPVVGGAADALADWLAVRGTSAGPLFVRIRKGDQIQDSRLSTQAVYHILSRRVQEAALAQGCSPHDMRRTFIGDLLDAGADIATVQKLAGHANVTTTARYDRRGEATKRKAAQMLHVPYFRARRSAAPPPEPVDGE
jgi:site-specific recombinase XerD